MKKLISVVLVSFLFLSFFLESNSQPFTPSSRMKNKFYIGAQGASLYSEYFNYYKQLSFGTAVDWGFSGDFQIPYGLHPSSGPRWYGGFYDTLSGTPTVLPPGIIFPDNGLTWGYKGSVDSMLTSWNNIVGSQNSVFIMLSKITRAAFGQRSTYETEYLPQQLTGGTIKPGYGYLKGINNYYTESWQGETVQGRRGQAGINQPQYLVDSLYENGEQTNVITRRDYTNAHYSDRKRIGDDYKWFVKPRMRIPQSIANDPDWGDSLVVRVEAYSYVGRKFFERELRVRNFLDGNGEYNGSYLENFYFDPVSKVEHLLSISADSLAVDIDTSNVYYIDPDNSKVDYRVYWYGKVDVWLDYVRLDDEWAHFLFTDPNDELDIDINRWQFGKNIENEVKAFYNNSGMGYFYIDETYYNSIPCMVEVLRLIKEYSNNQSGVTIMHLPAGFEGTGIGAGIKNELTKAEMFQRVKDAGLFTDFVNIDVYPLFDNTPLPPNITKPDPLLYPGTRQYINATSSQAYNEVLNEGIYEGYARDYFTGCADLIKNSPNTVFISTIQAHTVESNFIYGSDCNTIPNFEFKREPTNEELSYQAFFSMCYGAKQVHYFSQFSGEAYDTQCDRYYYDWGLIGLDIDQVSNLLLPRYTNYYGQPRWDYISSLNSNLLKIGKLMYEDNKLVYDATITTNKGESYGFFNSLKSYYRTPSAPYEFLEINEDAKKYWEIGFFSDPNEPLSKNFLILNKRCVPEIQAGQGDLRTVKFYFNSGSFTGFNNWILKDMITGESVTFNKNNMSNGVNFPYFFQPGQGKLLKLAPVMQEGGTLITDEVVTGVSFTCKAPVFSTGKDITLEPGTEVNFLNGTYWEIEQGRFFSGTITDDTPVILTSYNEMWNGLFITESPKIEMYHTVVSNINDSNSSHTALTLSNPHVLKIISCMFEDSGDTNNSVDISYNFTAQPREITAVINANTFNAHGGTMVGIYCSGSSSVDLQMQWNNFTNPYAGVVATGLVLSGVSGGVVKNNTFTNFSTSVKTMNSSVDYYNNLITSPYSGYGLELLSTSHATMSSPQDLFFGGNNFFYQDHTYSRNLNSKKKKTWFLIITSTSLLKEELIMSEI